MAVLMRRLRLLIVGVVLLAIGGVVGFALPHSNASPRAQAGSVISVGNVTPDAGLEFWFKPANGSKEQLRLQPATPWQKSRSDHWRLKGEPSCLVPGSTSATPVTIGIISTWKVGAASGRSIVVWVECYT
jgi:hypothetical protein